MTIWVNKFNKEAIALGHNFCRETTLQLQSPAKRPDMSNSRIWHEFTTNLITLLRYINKINTDLKIIATSNMRLLHHTFLQSRDYREFISDMKKPAQRSCFTLATENGIQCSLLTMIANQKINNLTDTNQRPMTNSAASLKNYLLMLYIVNGVITVQYLPHVTNAHFYRNSPHSSSQLLTQDQACMQQPAKIIDSFHTDSDSCQLLIITTSYPRSHGYLQKI